MTKEVKQRVIACINTFNNKLPQYKESTYAGLSEQLSLYGRNAHGMDPDYQLSGLIFLRYLRKMQKTKIKEVAHSERAHALLSASSSKQWLNCTPSARLQENFSNESSSFAEEGTVAHELAELLLRFKWGEFSVKEYLDIIKPIEANKYFSQSMIDYVELHIDYVSEQFAEARRKTPDAVLLIEERVNLTHLIEEGFGSCDVIIIADGIAEVIDLKYGMGVRVEAQDNTQLMLYGSGALEAYDMMYDIHTVKLTITQPRLDSISSWDILATDLRKWGEEVVKPKALIAYAGDGEQVTGDWCKFCRASPKCKAQSELAVKTAKELFTEPKLLDDEELLRIFTNIPQVSKWLDSVSKYVYDEAVNGKKWEGFKIVDGQNRRGWIEEEKVIETLFFHNYKEGEFKTSKLKGIGDIEKLVGKKNFSDILDGHVAFKKTSPSLVPESDKRPAINRLDDAKELFDDID